MNKVEANAIRELMESEGWDFVVRQMAKKISQWESENVIGASSYETLKLVFTREAKIQGLKDFFNSLETEL